MSGWKYYLVRAGVAAGVAFFGAFVGISTFAGSMFRGDPLGVLLSAAVAAGSAFFGSLASAYMITAAPPPGPQG